MPPPSETPPAASAGAGMTLASGLWLDQPDAEAEIERRHRAGALTGEQAERLAHFRAQGFLTFDLGLDPALFAGLERAVDGFWRDRPADLAYASGGPARRMSESDEARDRRRGSRIHDPHSHSAEALDLYLDPRIFEYARLILDDAGGEDAVAIQSLYFQFGSEQLLHRDPVVVPTGWPGHLLAAWIALEDIHPDSGALVYVPGSHLLPYFEFAPGRYEFDGSTMGEAEVRAATAFDDEQAARHGLTPRLFTPRRGEVLIWHGSLRHGGSPVGDAGLTRKSFVVHFSTASTYPRRAITIAELETDPGGRPVERPRVFATGRLLERDGRRGFDNPMRGGATS